MASSAIHVTLKTKLNLLICLKIIIQKADESIIIVAQLILLRDAIEEIHSSTQQ